MTLRLLTLSASALALGVATASAQSDVLDMTDWDQDADMRITPEEFTAGHDLEFSPRDDIYGFAEADAITEEQFVEGEFRRFDLDADEAWNEEEFLAAEESWRARYPEADIDVWAFDEFDVNADDVIDRNEFGTIQQRRAEVTVDGEPVVATYGAYDVDASGDLTAEEFAAAEFERYDLDNDGMLDEEEFSLWAEPWYERQ